MKPKTAFALTLTAAFLAAGLLGCASTEEKQSDLAGQARITRAEAEKIALAKVPGGTVKDAELEREKGRLIWSFDITKPGEKNITEVAVNAITGEVVSLDVETPAQQAKEAAEDAKKNGK